MGKIGRQSQLRANAHGDEKSPKKRHFIPKIGGIWVEQEDSIQASFRQEMSDPRNGVGMDWVKIGQRISVLLMGFYSSTEFVKFGMGVLNGDEKTIGILGGVSNWVPSHPAADF